jgi:mannose-1-phosphate guanylyltransferase
VNVWAVVLAGGVGSRFWPVSTPERPKQLLPLVSDEPLLLDTLSRLRELAPAERTLILTNASLAGAIRKSAAGVPPANVLAEPKPAGTAAALAWAASEIRRRGGERDVMVCVHADWAIRDNSAFTNALRAAARVAQNSEALVTVGVVPTRDDPGLGYVVAGAAHESGAFAVARFVEKPGREEAAQLRREGALWNSGIFAWRVDVFLQQLGNHTPEVAAALELADADAFFGAVKNVSIDVGLLERSNHVLVLPGDFGWDDIGTWSALLRSRPADPAGNVMHGTAYAVEATGNVVHAEGATVVLYGVHDLVVVASGDLTLVTTPERSSDLKSLLEKLPPEARDRE